MTFEMSLALRLGLWTGVLLALIAAGVYGILLLRKWLVVELRDENDTDEDAEQGLYTTAALDRLKEQGLVDSEQYETLRRKVEEAAKRRAKAEKRRRRRRKSSLFR